MKIIDLLNRIANNEELPEKIRYNDEEWELGTSEGKEIDYLRDNYIELFNQYLEYSLIESLNDKIEVLEDEEINIQKIEEYKTEYTERCIDIEVREKINEIIRAVKQLDSKINKEYCQNCGVELNAKNRALKNMCNECKYGLDR